MDDVVIVAPRTAPEEFLTSREELDAFLTRRKVVERLVSFIVREQRLPGPGEISLELLAAVSVHVTDEYMDQVDPRHSFREYYQPHYRLGEGVAEELIRRVYEADGPIIMQTILGGFFAPQVLKLYTREAVELTDTDKDGYLYFEVKPEIANSLQEYELTPEGFVLKA